MIQTGPHDFVHSQEPHLGVLLINLGTPDAPTARAVRRFLSEFLWDPRVVEIPRLLWWPILHGIILRIRPARSARRYQSVWTELGSPLLDIARRQAAAVSERLRACCPGPVEVSMGMRYGSPSIAAALHQLRAAGARRLLILPLYPQYSASTTASTFDAVAAELKTWRWLPELRMINHYHDHPTYIKALADSIRASRAREEAGERLLFSFHGLPKRNLLAGDPYYCECQKTARLVAEQLDLEKSTWAVSFQSRFGGAKWLEPYTSDLLQTWGREGVKRVDVICPGFAADCLETLEEIEQENRQIFLRAGGEHYRYIPALNDQAQHIDLLVDLIMTHCAGWPEISPDYNASEVLQARQATQSLARTMDAPY